MEELAFPTMIVALVLMVASVVAKVITAQLISLMKRTISNVTSIKQEAIGRLKMVQSHRAVAVQNKGVLTTKRTKLHKRLSRLKKEMGEIAQAIRTRASSAPKCARSNSAQTCSANHP